MNTLNADFYGLCTQARNELERISARETYVLATFSESGLITNVRSFRNDERALDAFATKCASDTDTTYALYMRDPDNGSFQIVEERMSAAPDESEDEALEIPMSDIREHGAKAAREIAQNEARNTKQTRKNGAKKMTKQSGISTDAIISAVASNPNRVNQTPITSVVHGERVAKIDTHKLIASDGSKLYAYVNASGVLTCETQDEAKARKAARAARRAGSVGMLSPVSANVANASAPSVAAPKAKAAPKVAAPSTDAPDAFAALQAQLAQLQAQLAAITAPSTAPVASARVAKAAPSVAKAAPSVATIGAENAKTIVRINALLSQLGTTQSKFEKANKVALESMHVMELRAIRDALKAQLAERS